MEQKIRALMQSCGLGTVMSPVESVSGGYLHRMYRVTTDAGVYAVKHLNPAIMRRPDAFDNFRRAEMLEGTLERENLPIVPAITTNSAKMQCVGGDYFYIFRWQPGHITDWNAITPAQCHIAGNILGRIHAIDPQEVPRTVPELCSIDWAEYLRKAEAQQHALTPLLTENLDALICAEREYHHAQAHLPGIRCISNADMDPKNVMWHGGKAFVIDLECLDYSNPASDVMELVLQWAGAITYDLTVEKIAAFFDGYLAAYDNGFRGYADIFGIAYFWVNWLEYNLRRALGEYTDDAERALGCQEVQNTIARIRYIQEMQETIKAHLRTI